MSHPGAGGRGPAGGDDDATLAITKSDCPAVTSSPFDCSCRLRARSELAGVLRLGAQITHSRALTGPGYWSTRMRVVVGARSSPAGRPRRSCTKWGTVGCWRVAAGHEPGGLLILSG